MVTWSFKKSMASTCTSNTWPVSRAVSRVSAAHSLWCAPAARPVGRALEAGSRRDHPAAFRRVLMLMRTPRGVRFLVFRPEKPSAIVRALRCAQVLLTLAGSPDSSRKLFPRAPAWRPALISWENFVSFLRFQDLHCASRTNRHFVPSRAKNEEESRGGRRVTDSQPRRTPWH